MDRVLAIIQLRGLPYSPDGERLYHCTVLLCCTRPCKGQQQAYSCVGPVTSTMAHEEPHAKRLQRWERLNQALKAGKEEETRIRSRVRTSVSTKTTNKTNPAA